MNADDYRGWLAVQPDSAFAPPEGKSVALAHSGFDTLNRQFAINDATAQGSKYYTIEQIEVGRYLDQARLYEEHISGLSEEQADDIWSIASRRFAENAVGAVETCVVDAHPGRIFRATELPAFLSNERVETINGIPRADLCALHAEDQEAAYRRICEAELAREQDRARTTQDEQIKTRAEWKQQAFDLQQETARQVERSSADGARGQDGAGHSGSVTLDPDLQVLNDRVNDLGYVQAQGEGYGR